MRRDAVERFRVSTLRAGDAIEFRERGIVTEERLQPRRFRGGQLHLRVEHIELRAGAGVETRLGQTHRFRSLLDIFS